MWRIRGERRAARVFLATLVGMCMNATAHAIPIGHNFDLPPSATIGVDCGFELNCDALGSNFPIDVIYDGTAGPISKQFINTEVRSQSESFTITESFRLSGGLPLHDWHERIGSPDWDWVSGEVKVDGMTIAVGMVMTTPTQSDIWFKFKEDITPFTNFDITKVIHCRAAGGCPSAPFDNPLVILETATIPEPSSLGLLSAGLVLLALSRRRHANAL